MFVGIIQYKINKRLCIFRKINDIIKKTLETGETDMKLIQLEYFCETARCLSITRAAQKLYVTQPAVSSAVKELEKEFSVQLFTHVGNRLALTEEGKAFYEQGEQLLRQVEDTSRKLKDLGKQVPGSAHWNSAVAFYRAFSGASSSVKRGMSQGTGQSFLNMVPPGQQSLCRKKSLIWRW